MKPVLSLNDLTHMSVGNSTLCGKGLYNAGKGSLNLVPQFMGKALSEPTCKQCREKVNELNLLR